MSSPTPAANTHDATPSPTTVPTTMEMASTSTDEVSSTAPIAPAAAGATDDSTTPKPVSSTSADDEDEDAAAVAATSDADPLKSASPVPAEVELKNTPPTSPSQITVSPRTLSITVLLVSGARHSFTMDSGYLERHAVKTGSGKEAVTDPFEMSVWQLKECIWKDWREDWDQRPASALFIRLIQFGAYLDDRHMLKDCRLTADSPNVIHLAIRPAEAGDDDLTQRSTKGAFGRSSDRDGGGRTPTCRCVIL